MALPSQSATPVDAGECHGQVLIVDDSAVARAVMARMIDASDRFMVAGAVATATAALDFLARARVDFILLDIHMPGIDGLTALPGLIAAGRGAKVLVVSSTAGEGAAATLQALALGAADTLTKPEPGAMRQNFEAALLDKLRRLGEASAVAVAATPAPAPTPAPRVAAAARPVPATEAPAEPKAGHDEYDIVAIGASTGGIHALSQLLRAIPAGFRLPILVTQHLPGSFMPYFAAQLALLAGRPCEVAVDRLRIRPGRLIVAPGDGHIRVVRLADGSCAVRLTHEPASSGCMPSVDPMFASIAAVYGDRALGIVLSGMGRDGADGARRLHDAGAQVLVQDQASSVIWGMPGATVAAGAASAILSPDAIGRVAATRRRY